MKKKTTNELGTQVMFAVPIAFCLAFIFVLRTLRELLSSEEDEALMAAEGEYFTCKGREGTPDVRFKNRDRWERRGPDLVCSYCGSMDPDDFMLWAHRSLEDDSKVVIDSGKIGKYYIRREGISNASQGAIKFYAFHFTAPPSPEDHETLSRALIVGATRMRGQTRDLFEKLEREDRGK